VTTRPRQLQIWIVALVVIVDQITKFIARRELALHESVVVIPDFFDLTRVHNTGAAFGFMNSLDLPYKSTVLAIVRAAALVALSLFAATLPASQWLARSGVALVLGGALGNLVDSLTAGYVLDFFDFYWRGWHFWAFNVADASITIGMALIILDQLGLERHRVSRAV
jgi:signal peptidase II